MYSHYVACFPASKSVCIYGTGGASHELSMLLDACRPDITILYYFDSFKDNGNFRQKPVINLTRLHNYTFDYIIIASAYAEDIERSLQRHGVKYPIYRFYKNSSLFTRCIPHLSNYSIGDYTYGNPTVYNASERRGLPSNEFNATLKIGKFCSLAENVSFFCRMGSSHRFYNDFLYTSSGS